MTNIYSTQRWRDVRQAVLTRDRGLCSVGFLFGGACSDASLHGHHIVPLAENGDPFDESNLLSVCRVHHPQLEAMRRYVLARREPRPARCPHLHRTREAREQCERRLAARNGRELVAA